MIRRRRRVVRSTSIRRGLLLVTLVLVPRPAWSWGCAGHEVIALLAGSLLTERARAEATRLLVANPIDPHLRRYCNGVADAFVDAATWADDIRDERPETAPWHYVDLPRGAANKNVRCPAEGCVTKAIETERAVLHSRAPDRMRAEALRYLIHFVGDVHQPLHCASNGDKGGNCLPVRYLGDEPVRDSHKPKYLPNLHSVWDSGLVTTLLSRPRRRGASSVVQALRRRFADDIPAWMSSAEGPGAWTLESHRVAVEIAYGKLEPPVPVEPPVAVTDCRGNHDVGKRMRALGVRIDERYVDVALPVVERQLAIAAARLARMLNDVWP